jgi:putative PIN family toxin of toxin-antitoxin system
VRVTVDNSVWISAAINPNGHPARIKDALAAGHFDLVVSEPMLAELAKVLARRRIARRTGLTPEEQEEFLNSLRDLADVVTLTGEVRLCRDPNDDTVIETALVGKANVLVSRDEDLTRTPELAGVLAQAGVRVLTVARFLAELEGEE